MRSDFMLMNVRRASSLTAALSAVLVAGCADQPDYPVTQKAVRMSSLNAADGKAPPVAANVTSERIERARSEPRNWLTYYGAYDGQRYSTLDQVDTTNVSQLRDSLLSAGFTLYLGVEQ